MSDCASTRCHYPIDPAAATTRGARLRATTAMGLHNPEQNAEGSLPTRKQSRRTDAEVLRVAKQRSDSDNVCGAESHVGKALSEPGVPTVDCMRSVCVAGRTQTKNANPKSLMQKQFPPTCPQAMPRGRAGGRRHNIMAPRALQVQTP